jgi:NADPH:quinone reductase
MKAIQVTEFGGPDVLKMVDLDRPDVGEGEAVVEIVYAGVNFIDVYMRNGTYARSHTYQTTLPLVIGMEGAGTVVEVAPGVSNVSAGDRVAYCLSRGSYAHYAAVPAWRLVKVPEDIPLDVATALMLQGCTAHYLTHSAFSLSSGDTCLVHAGAGGVGQLLIQLAKLRGATVITTAGSEEKAEIATRCGADHTILYREVDFGPAVRELTDGRGVDVVYDSVGKETIARSIRSLRRRGLCVNFGGSSGTVTAIAPLDLAEAGSVFFTRPHLADYTASAAEIGERVGDLFSAVAAGTLRVHIDRELPLQDAALAHTTIESRGTKGKLLLRADA